MGNLSNAVRLLVALTMPMVILLGDSLIISNVTLVDVSNGSLKPGMTIIIRDNRIIALEPAATVSPDENKVAQILDGHGKYAIPGLWDMHVHLGNATEAALPMLLTSGITGVRDMGSPSFETLRRWRLECLIGTRLGPRIVAAGPMLDGGPPDANRIIVRNADDARRAVFLLSQMGVDFVKVHEHLDRETYFAIAREAKTLGLPLAGHVPARYGVRCHRYRSVRGRPEEPGTYVWHTVSRRQINSIATDDASKKRNLGDSYPYRFLQPSTFPRLAGDA